MCKVKKRWPLASFIFVGGIGFFVDVGVLYLCMEHVGPFYGRCSSLFCSMITTWLLNRKITYNGRVLLHGLWAELSKYMTIMLLGFSINYMTFALLMWRSDAVRADPILGVAIGSGLALTWNYRMLRRVLDQPA